MWNKDWTCNIKTWTLDYKDTEVIELSTILQAYESDFFKKNLKGISPFSVATDTHIWISGDVWTGL